MPPFLLSCLAYLGVALPGSTLGLLWPSMRMSIHEPVGALGIVLAAGVAASAVSSAATGRILRTMPPGPPLAIGAALISIALAAEAAASALWVIAVGSAVFSVGFGAIDTALNVYAAAHFGPKHINWMHASYGLGATLGPLLMAPPLPGGFAVAGMAVLGLAAAPVFPLITLVTGGSGGGGTDGGAATAVGLQVAASAVGSAALPSGVGLAVGAFGGWVVGPSLLALGLAMCVVYWAALR